MLFVLHPRCGRPRKARDPSAAIITTEFERETELTRMALGMQGLIPIVIDHPVSSITQAEVELRAAQVALQAPKVWLSRE